MAAPAPALRPERQRPLLPGATTPAMPSSAARFGLLPEGLFHPAPLQSAAAADADGRSAVV